MNKENKQTAINGLEEHLGCKIEDLREITYIIYKSYKDKFSTKKIYGQNQFHIICQNVTDKTKDSYWTLAEKVVKRQYDMNSLKSSLKDNQVKIKELEEARALEDIMERLMPLEILWAMEEEHEDGYTFNDHEQKSYDYLVSVATYFLEQTKEFEKLLEDLNFTLSNVKRLRKK